MPSFTGQTRNCRDFQKLKFGTTRTLDFPQSTLDVRKSTYDFPQSTLDFQNSTLFFLTLDFLTLDVRGGFPGCHRSPPSVDPSPNFFLPPCIELLVWFTEMMSHSGSTRFLSGSKHVHSQW
jgi:hypothetical protein